MSKKITAYIAGKVSGLSAQQAAQHFADMQHELLQSGYNVINPVEELRKVNDRRRRRANAKKTKAELAEIWARNNNICGKIHRNEN